MDWRNRGDDPEWEPEWEQQAAALSARRNSSGAAQPAHLTVQQQQQPSFRSVSAPLHRLSEAAAADEPIICQVEGCIKDIRAEKEYYQRYRICEEHLKLSSLLKDGIPQRFCQQCGRFHELSEFDGDKRSCRARLSLHNNRRRKRGTAAGGGEGVGRGRRQRARQKKAPTVLQERRAIRAAEAAAAELDNAQRLSPHAGLQAEDANVGSAGSSYGALSAGADRLRQRGFPEQPIQRAMSLSESAGFHAPPELLNAMELISGELPYLPPDASQSGARMMRHRSLTEEPVLAFGGSPVETGRREELFKSASDPLHIMQGMGSLTWGDLAALGHSGVPPAMRTAIESGFRLEPRMLQQYANLQQQSPMPSVRIPPPMHEGGRPFNPFYAGFPPPASSAGASGSGFAAGGFGSGGGQLPRDLLQQQWQDKPLHQSSVQRVSDSYMSQRFSSDSFQAASVDTLQRWSSHEGFGGRGPGSHVSEGLGSRPSGHEASGLGSRLSSHEGFGGASGRRPSPEALLSPRHQSGGQPAAGAAFARAYSGGVPASFSRHSSADVRGLPAQRPRVGERHPGVRRPSPSEFGAGIAASSEHLLGSGGLAMAGDPYHGADADAAQARHGGLPGSARAFRLPAVPGYPATPGAGGTGGGGFLGSLGSLPPGGGFGGGMAYAGTNPFSTRSDPLLMQRHRAAYAHLSRQESGAAAGAATVHGGSIAGSGGISSGPLLASGAVAHDLPPVFDEADFAPPPPPGASSGDLGGVVQSLSQPSFQALPQPQQQPQRLQQPSPQPQGAGQQQQRSPPLPPPSPASPAAHANKIPGGGFTVTTGGSPQMHSFDPLQAKLQQLSALAAARAQQQQQQQQQQAQARAAAPSPHTSADGSSGSGMGKVEQQQQLQQQQQASQQVQSQPQQQWGGM